MVLINRDFVIDVLWKQRTFEPKHRRTILRSIQLIMEQPKVDAVPVVRCKDCIHYDDSINGEASCFISGYPLEDPNGFCSAGTDTIE